MSMLPKIPRSIARNLKFYVYLYVNPLNGKNVVFYVGKGRGSRALAHLNASEKRKVTKTIKEIRSEGQEPVIEILAHGLETEEMAFAIESAAIDLLGLDQLANSVKGHGQKYGRRGLEEVVARYTKRKVNIKEPSILIRVNKRYQYGMTDVDLYDATRCAL